MDNLHETTKWISWKEFAQTGPEKVCDKVIINKLGSENFK
jgi:hypothetical protein